MASPTEIFLLMARFSWTLHRNLLAVAAGSALRGHLAQGRVLCALALGTCGWHLAEVGLWQFHQHPASYSHKVSAVPQEGEGQDIGPRDGDNRPLPSSESLCSCIPQANLRAIISSEQRVAQLMSSIDEALAEVARVEETLQVCDELLGSVKQQMDHIHRENSLLHRIASNRARLMDEILFLTVRGFTRTSISSWRICWEKLPGNFKR